MTHIEGFVPLADYDDRRGDGGKERGHTAEYKALRKAIEEDEVEGWQHGGSGRWLVNKVQADRHLLELRRPPCNSELRRKAVMEDKDPSYYIDRRGERKCLERIAETLDAIHKMLMDRDVVLDSPQWHPKIEQAVEQ